ncbi:DUF6126 family protein [Streptomyces sp. TS71-3]|uniref:DUF6126 family protein n=1 Tax=Streptomyces sp. TS71-3 TaxID=2733862 RepID=UPI001B0FBE3F|nr:DUF6126 family protein [Streptomyces sp. TS71-3]GHJ41867.1 hypothetical protein Sm713_74760 [Streptomyces sp. TS71-3]
MTDTPERRRDATGSLIDPTHPIEDRIPRGIWVRVLIYVAAGHLLAGFLFLLFSIGAKS